MCFGESGRFSTTLKPLKKEATVEDVQVVAKDVKKLQKDIQQVLTLLGQKNQNQNNDSEQQSIPKTGTLFKEVYDEAKGDGFADSGKGSGNNEDRT